MVLLGREELREIEEAQETLETHCRFCGERYLLSGQEIARLARLEAVRPGHGASAGHSEPESGGVH
jgi:hypothetical protein